MARALDAPAADARRITTTKTWSCYLFDQSFGGEVPTASRRQFLLSLAAAPLVLTMSCSDKSDGAPAPPRNGARPLPIPPLADSTVDADGVRIFTLRAAPGLTEMVAGTDTATWGYNGSILGPTLRARNGETVAVTFDNGLEEPTSVHWHGAHLPAQSDGGPHQTVLPGGRWQPSWTIQQPSATLWYHPHPHGETEKHVYRGLAGMFIVDDDSPADLPHDYGVDDIPLIIQDRKFTATGALDESESTDVGLLGDTIIVNGIAGAYLPVLSERIRLRILNGSGGRVYNLGFTDDRRFHVVASDGGLLSAPADMNRIQLSPGERVEIVVEFRPGVPVMLRSFPIENRGGCDIAEARQFGMLDTLDILELRPAPVLHPSVVLPSVLADLGAPDISQSAVQRSFDLQWFMINGTRMDMNRIDFSVTVDTDEVWSVRNVDNWPHNFHVHDAQFRIVDIDAAPPPPELAGYKDTVYVAPGQRVRLVIRFSEYTDPTYPYMFHCHLAMHEDHGMMGQFLVLAPGQEPAPMVMDMPVSTDDVPATHGRHTMRRYP